MYTFEGAEGARCGFWRVSGTCSRAFSAEYRSASCSLPGRRTVDETLTLMSPVRACSSPAGRLRAAGRRLETVSVLRAHMHETKSQDDPEFVMMTSKNGFTGLGMWIYRYTRTHQHVQRRARRLGAGNVTGTPAHALHAVSCPVTDVRRVEI